MREIKFRAWARFDKVMLSNSDIWFKTNVQGYELFCDTPDNKDSWILMQYTGLKDKNGVEIYEGDIVKVQGWNKTEKEWCRNMEVVFDEGCFCLKHGSGMYAFFRDIEVIGNIYENPELLE